MCLLWVILLKTPRILVESFASVARIASKSITKVRSPLRDPCSAYLICIKDEKNTKETVDEEGWVHTGDVAEIDHCGRIKIVDRVKVSLYLPSSQN
jgi:acyl-CoA synthetase (AMP-forming)/AMP-acid ligase II